MSVRPLLCLILLSLGLSGCALSDGDDDPSRPPQLAQQQGSSEDGDDEALPVFGVPPAATKGTIRLGGDAAVADAVGVASVVYPATSETTRPEAVVLVDADDWQAGVAASVFMARPLQAPLLLSQGDELPGVTEEMLGRLDPEGGEFLDKAEVIAIGEQTLRPEGRKTEAIAAKDPYTLAASIDQTVSAVAGSPSDDVIVTTGERPAFAMPAAAWAARSGDAVLFTQRDELPAATKKALGEHEKPDIFILGPTSVVGAGVEKELAKLGRVQRIAGENPVENAVEFARFREEDFGWGITAPGANFTVANTERPLDAAAAAALATKGTFAPLLLNDEAAKLSPQLEGYLLDVQPGYDDDPNASVFNRVFLLGDNGALSLDVQGRLDEITELVPVRLEQDEGGETAPRDDRPRPDDDKAQDGAEPKRDGDDGERGGARPGGETRGRFGGGWGGLRFGGSGGDGRTDDDGQGGGPADGGRAPRDRAGGGGGAPAPPARPPRGGPTGGGTQSDRP